MSVFISHMFGGDDDVFANLLKEDLDSAGLGGYLAEESRRYDLLISDKIREEINRSGCLVAIITGRSQASASVHEEIGYALGKNVEVVLMVEKNVKERGVLIYGREPEVFDPQRFAAHSRKIVEYIKNSPHAAPAQPLGDAARALLEKRNMMSAESRRFGENRHYDSLYADKVYQDSEKPAVLFTACPGDLRDRQSVVTAEFIGWATSTLSLKFNRGRRRMDDLQKRIDVKTLHLTKKDAYGMPGSDISMYWEFQNNGFMEYGTSLYFVRQNYNNWELHLCHAMGDFWLFLECASQFYSKLGIKSPCSVLLSVKNSSKMTLSNYGNESMDRSWEDRQALLPFSTVDPHTDHANLQIPHTFGTADGMTGAGIEKAVREVAQTLCNAYGEERAKCFDENGAFAWRLWEHVAS